MTLAWLAYMLRSDRHHELTLHVPMHCVAPALLACVA
jgi:hypothetical protein